MDVCPSTKYKLEYGKCYLLKIENVSSNQIRQTIEIVLTFINNWYRSIDIEKFFAISIIEH